MSVYYINLTDGTVVPVLASSEAEAYAKVRAMIGR